PFGRRRPQPAGLRCAAPGRLRLSGNRAPMTAGARGWPAGHGRVVITGGAGFLGSHLCDRLVERGHEVICVDNCVTGSTANVEHLMGHSKFSFLRHDVSRPLSVDGAVDAILHFASPASPRDYLELPIQTLKVGS